MFQRPALQQLIRGADYELRRVALRCRSTWSEGASIMTRTSESPLLEELDINGVLALTLNRPKQRNALDRRLLEQLHESLARAAASTAADFSAGDDKHTPVRVVVLQSQGRVFSSGHDLKELIGLRDAAGETTNDEANDEIHDLFATCSSTMQLLQEIPQPTICAVDGLATAAGCQLVASCDIVVASRQASFQTPGVTIGLFCHTPAVPLIRCIGMKRAMDMLFTGRAVSAEEAFKFGLVSRLVENPQIEAAEIAKVLATGMSSATLQMGKQVVYKQQSARDLKEAYSIAGQAMEENMRLMDARIGIESFIQKTKPAWKHK